MHPQCGFHCVQHTGDMEEGGGMLCCNAAPKGGFYKGILGGEAPAEPAYPCLPQPQLTSERLASSWSLAQ